MGSEMKITGSPVKEILKKEDGTAVLTFKDAVLEGLPKPFKGLGQTIYLVRIGVKQWKKLNGKVDENTFFIIKGKSRARISPKNTPYIEVVATNVELKEDAEPAQKKEKDQPQKKTSPKKEPKAADESPALKQPAKKKTKSKKKNSPKHNPIGMLDYCIDKEKHVINVSDIILTEQIHLTTGMQVYFSKNQVQSLSKEKKLKQPLIVRKMEDGKYSLVMGLKTYILAKTFMIDTVEAVITEKTRSQVCAEIECLKKQAKTVKMADLSISDRFKQCPPSKEKVDNTIAYYEDHNKFDKPILITEEGLLLDGYKRYMAAKQLGLTEIDAIVKNISNEKDLANMD